MENDCRGDQFYFTLKYIVMKKLVQILPLILFAAMVNAQQTEDDIYVGKSRTFGNYRGETISTVKQMKGQVIVAGTVVKVDWCEEDCLTVWVKKDDGSTVSVGTKDYGFTVPKKIVGKRIIIEGIEPAKYVAGKKAVKKEYQKGIQIAATGVRILD
jgi:hypothetical protein